jgi:hypothetical protein
MKPQKSTDSLLEKSLLTFNKLSEACTLPKIKIAIAQVVLAFPFSFPCYTRCNDLQNDNLNLYAILYKICTRRSIQKEYKLVYIDLNSVDILSQQSSLPSESLPDPLS